VLTTTRRQLPPHQAVHNCTPVDFNQVVGRPLFGVPLVLNTDVAAAAFQTNQQATGPPILYRPLPERPVLQAKRSVLGKKFRALKFCWRCGFQKKLHLRANVPFGDNCHSNCLHDECSKCGWRLEDFHDGNMVGPFCPRQATQKDCGDWYKKVQTGII